MTALSTWTDGAAAITEALGLDTPPIAITFTAQTPNGVAAFDKPMPEPTADGRTGRVAAGCVFWTEAIDKTFTTVVEDHGNCSVGLLTHGFKTLDEIMAGGPADVEALLSSGWVTIEMVPGIPVVAQRPGAVTYGPLAETPIEPDVVVIRVNAEQLMMLVDAVPGLRIDGKPQCQIVVRAKQFDEVAVSAGCILSRTRIGMPSSQMTVAIPAAKFADLVACVQSVAQIDGVVAGYAAADAQRFVTAS